MTPQQINKAIAEDIKQKSGCKTAYALYQKYNIANEGTMRNILTAKSNHAINLTILFALYKAMGYNEINIKEDKMTLVVKPV